MTNSGSMASDLFPFLVGFPNPTAKPFPPLSLWHDTDTDTLSGGRRRTNAAFGGRLGTKRKLIDAGGVDRLTDLRDGHSSPFTWTCMDLFHLLGLQYDKLSRGIFCFCFLLLN